MRTELVSRRLGVSILVIGMLAITLTLVCSEGIHAPLSGSMDGNCVAMSHSGLTSGALGSDTAQTLVTQLMVLAFGLAASVAIFDSPVRLALVIATPSPPPDPSFGRLRI